MNEKIPDFSGIFIRRGDWIRTSDHLHPMQVRYRAALHPEWGGEANNVLDPP